MVFEAKTFAAAEAAEANLKWTDDTNVYARTTTCGCCCYLLLALLPLPLILITRATAVAAVAAAAATRRPCQRKLRSRRRAVGVATTRKLWPLQMPLVDCALGGLHRCNIAIARLDGSSFSLPHGLHTS